MGAQTYNEQWEAVKSSGPIIGDVKPCDIHICYKVRKKVGKKNKMNFPRVQ